MDVFSLFVYNFYAFISVGAAYVAQRNKNKFLILLSYLICLLFWGIRKDIGFDYIGYVEIFYNIQDGNDTYVELGYLLLNRFFVTFRDGYVYVLFISTAVTFAFLFKALIKYKILWQGLLFSLVFQFQFMAANQVRQAMAIAVFLAALPLLGDKKYIKYIISVLLITILLHASAAILLLAIPISRLNFNRYVCVILVIVTYIAYSMGIWSNLGYYLLSILPIPDNYAHFLSSNWVFNEEIGISLVQLFNISMSLYIIWNKKFVPNYIISVYFVGILLYLVFIEYHLFLRMSFYFTYLNIIAISIVCKKRPKSSKIVVLLSVLFFILLCCQSTNMHGVIPYQTIL